MHLKLRQASQRHVVVLVDILQLQVYVVHIYCIILLY